MRKTVVRLILFLMGFQLIIYFLVNKEFFLRKFDFAYLAELYSKSQYVLGPASRGGIGDDGLYAFAGYYYLFQKGDVSAVNFEHPPLGKYLIGVSVFLFNNENVINIVYYLTLLFFTYNLGKLIVKDNLLSISAIGFLSSNLLILDNLKRSLLDLPFTLFFTIAVYFFLLALKEKKYYYLSMLFWSVAFSIRFFPALLIIYIYLFIIVFIYRRSHLTSFIFSSFLIPFVYLISHISFFVYHPSIFEFLRHKKWMLAWFSGAVSTFGNIWINIFTGHYFDTEKKLVSNNQWDIYVPMIVVSALLPIKKVLFDKRNVDFLVLYGIIILYFIYLTFLTTGVEKFLMHIYPILCVLAVNNLTHLYSIIVAWKKTKLRPLRVN